MLNFLNVIPQGHEKALKQAFYNAVALFVLFLCSAGGWALFYVLEPFVKPLVWAVLIGSVLHPFKHSLAKRFEQWFHQVNASSSPICFGFFMIPLHMMDNISETIGCAIMSNIRLIMGLGVGILSVFLIYMYTPCISLVGYFWYISSSLLLSLMDNLGIYIFMTFITLYITALIFYWNEENKYLMSIGSYVMWFIISLFIARTFGIFQIPLLLFILFALCFGFAYEVFTFVTSSAEKISFWKAIKQVLEETSTSAAKPESKKDDVGEEEKNEGRRKTHLLSTNNDSATDLNEVEENKKVDKSSKSEIKTTHLKMPSLVRSSSDNMEKLDLYKSLSQTFRKRDLEPEFCNKNADKEESSKYICAVIWACALMMIWKNFWIIHLLPIPIAIYFVKRIGLYFGLWSLISSQWCCLMESVTPFFKVRRLAIFPPPVQGLYKFTGKLRINIMNGIHYSINSFASSLVILGLIFFTFGFSFFVIFQIYAEGIHLITVGAGIVNFTVVNNPEFHQLLPEGWTDKMESVINDAYVYGREGISKQVQHVLRDVDQAKAVEFEKHVLELWDRIYQAWLVGSVDSRSSIGPKVTSNAVFTSWDNFLGTFHKMPDLFNITVMTDFAKENVGTLLSLLESVWNLLKGNLSLIFQFLFTTMSLLLGGGTVVLNFLISTIVFFTALFYLLSSSGARYKPVELLANFSPSNGSKLGGAFENAVNGVFKASFKMALFYGLWTWLIHNFFQVRIVYIPSVLAAVLGAVPFLGTYWASVPAVLDLWLAQQKGMQAIFLFLFQCLPISFVDTAIYREIKEGHPYMTGLAIAGGVFCMGIQGAIFGPILLCCLLVALNMSSNLMKESPSDPSISTISMRQLRRDKTKENNDEGNVKQ